MCHKKDRRLHTKRIQHCQCLKKGLVGYESANVILSFDLSIISEILLCHSECVQPYQILNYLNDRIIYMFKIETSYEQIMNFSNIQLIHIYSNTYIDFLNAWRKKH